MIGQRSNPFAILDKLLKRASLCFNIGVNDFNNRFCNIDGFPSILYFEQTFVNPIFL